MTEESLIDIPANLPVSFRILGIGDNLKPVIEKIVAREYEGVSASVVSKDELIVPTDEDRMVIILADECGETAKDIAKGFYQAGVLTLIITTAPIIDATSFCDSQSISEVESMYNDVKAILDILTRHGYICLDFSDISEILRNSGYFRVIETVGKEDGSRVADALSKIDKKLSGQEMALTEKIIIAIFFNRDIRPAVTVNEVKQLSDYVTGLPEKITTIWAIFHDGEMTTDEVRLSTIISGNKLKLS